MPALITKQVIFKTAKQLIEQGIYPTQNNVRELLGHGSMRDIGFYLREWKQQCFAANKAVPSLQAELTSTALELDELEQVNKKTTKLQTQLQQQVDSLTAKQKSLEQQAEQWQFQAETLQGELANTTTEYHKLKEQYNYCQELLKEKDNTIQLIMQDKNQLIESLRQELKETTKQAILEAREENHKHHETMLNMQVENTNLQIEMKNLTKKIKEQDEQLLTLKLSINPLKQALQEKEAIIKSYVTPNELDEYARNCCK